MAPRPAKSSGCRVGRRGDRAVDDDLEPLSRTSVRSHRHGVDMVSLRHHSDVVPDSRAPATPLLDLSRPTVGAPAIAVTDLVRTYRKRESWFRSREIVEAVRGISFEI